jgi:hypothetical protein
MQKVSMFVEMCLLVASSATDLRMSVYRSCDSSEGTYVYPNRSL